MDFCIRPEIPRICLVVAGVIFLMSAFVLGDATRILVIAAIFAVVPSLFGRRWIRGSGIALLIISLGMSVVTHRKAEHLEKKIQQLRERARSN